MATCSKGRKKIFCDVCSAYISSETLLVMHNNGKKHQRLMKIREERRESTARSIYVRGFDNRITLERDLNEYFSHFGKVSSIFVDKEKAKYAIIEFECPTVAGEILASKQLPLFYEKHLIIKRRILKEPKGESPKKSSKFSKTNTSAVKTNCFLGDEVVERLKSAKTLDDQVLTLVSSTCLTEDDLKLRSLIVQYLQGIFVEAFPACVVSPFGSTSTGLGLKGADMDLCLLVDPDSLKIAFDGDDSLPSSSDQTKQVLEFIVNILRQFAAGFHNVVAVTSAKCPLVKFTHRDYGLTCDMSINNRLAIRNTELIKSYVALDGRIRPLAIALKNWGAAKCLTGSGGRRISNYCLILMLLHFLQRTRPPVVPVLQLARGKMSFGESAVTEMTIDGWDCTFMSTAPGMSSNRESLGTLLRGWFQYYGTTFDYVHEVITIQHDINQRILKSSIRLGGFPAAVEPSLFKPSALCVQDPFELSHNLTQKVSEETLRRFIQSCVEAYTTLSKYSEQTTGSSMEGGVKESDTFIELFTISDDTLRPKKSFYSFTFPLKVKSATFTCTPLQHSCDFIIDLLRKDLQILCEFQPEKRVHEGTPTDKTFSNLESTTGGDEICGDTMCIDEDVRVNEDIVLASRKRPHEDEDLEELGVKRMKTGDENESNSFTLLCRATEITWKNRRRQRRLHSMNEDATNTISGVARKYENVEMQEAKGSEKDNAPLDAGDSCMDESSSPVATNIVNNTIDRLPLIEFKLTISEHTGNRSNLTIPQQCNVVLSHLGGSLQHFSNFYAFFKKFVVQKIAECM